MVKVPVKNRLAEIRKSKGLGASELARRVQVGRQTIHAIEAGTYVPNTVVALHLARELRTTVEELFSTEEIQKPSEFLATELLSAEAPKQGQAARICQVGSRWVSIPVSASPYYMQEADGIIRRRRNDRADLAVFAKQEASPERLVLAGCDPATGLLSSMVEKISGVEIVCAAASSKLALTWLSEGKVHIAGSHLEDPKTGEFNLPFLRKEFPTEDFSVVTFARWEEGLVIASGNPIGIREVADLARKSVRFINREPGSGSRALLDRCLQKAGIKAARVRGYDRVAYGHLAAAYAVASREVDVCLATRSAAQAFGLGFIPLRSERYDFVMRKRTSILPAAKALLDVLQQATLRQKLKLLAGYDTSKTGVVVA